MEFKLDDPNEQKKPTSHAEPALADDDGYYHAPVTSAPTAIEPEKKPIQIPKFIIVFIIVAILALVLSRMPFNKKKELDTIARMPMSDIEQELGITLSENPDFVKQLSIPNGDPTGFQVYTNSSKDFGVIYYNGKQYGICFSSSKYSLYGVEIGDSESHLFLSSQETQILPDGKEPGYSYTSYFYVIEDMMKKGSTADYVMGSDGSVLVLVVNDTSNRVVNIIYYYDSNRVLKDVDFF